MDPLISMDSCTVSPMPVISFRTHKKDFEYWFLGQVNNRLGNCIIVPSYLYFT